MSDKKEKKSKKEKIIYIDDGRTIADMSALPKRNRLLSKGTSSPVKAILRTYWDATKMMLLPTLAIVGLLLAVFLIVTLIFWLM